MESKSNGNILCNKSYIICAQFIGLVIVAIEWTALWHTLRERSPICIRLACISISSFLVLIQVVAICLVPFYPVVDWEASQGSGDWYSLDVWFISALFFVTSGLFFMSGVSFRRGMATFLSQRADIKLTLNKVNFTAFVCTVVFGIRFLSWAYGDLVFNLYIIPETTWMWDLDQIFYPTIHYTIPDIVPDVLLLHLLSPNASDYTLPNNDGDFGDDEDSSSSNQEAPVINYQLSINSDQHRSYASLIDQDDEERRTKKKKKSTRSTSSTGSNSYHSYKRDGSFLMGSKSFYTEADYDAYSQDSGSTRSSDSNTKNTTTNNK